MTGSNVTVSHVFKTITFYYFTGITVRKKEKKRGVDELFLLVEKKALHATTDVGRDI